MTWSELSADTGYSEAVARHFDGRRHGGISSKDTTRVWNFVFRELGAVAVCYGNAFQRNQITYPDRVEELTDEQVMRIVMQHCITCTE